MIAYRLGTLSHPEPSKELEQLPAGPRVSLSSAMQLKLPDGTFFHEASEQQIMKWFAFLTLQASLPVNILDETLSGLDLTEFDDRWWALNELLEMGAIRDVFEGRPVKPVVTDPLPDAIGYYQLVRIVGEYGLRVTEPRKPDGTAQVYAQSNSSVNRLKIYVCGLAQLESGQVTEKKVRAKLEKRGLSVIRQQEGRKVA